MSVKLTLEFESYEALVDFVIPNAAAVNKANFSVTHPIVAPAPDKNCVTTPDGDCIATEPCMHSAPAPVAEAPKPCRGRPPKAAAPAVSAPRTADVATVGTAAPFEAPAKEAVEVPTHEQAIDAQKALYDAKGAEACIVVLQRHGANRISEIKPEQRERFIKDCNDALAGKDLSAAA